MKTKKPIKVKLNVLTLKLVSKAIDRVVINRGICPLENNVTYKDLMKLANALDEAAEYVRHLEP